MLNANQLAQLKAVKDGNGRYWPFGRAIHSLKALANRKMVAFRFGFGWSILPLGEDELDNNHERP